MERCSKCNGSGKVSGFLWNKQCNKCKGRGHIIPRKYPLRSDSFAASTTDDQLDYDVNQSSYYEETPPRNFSDYSNTEDNSSSRSESSRDDSSSSDNGSSSSSD